MQGHTQKQTTGHTEAVNKEYNYMGHRLYYHDNLWMVERTDIGFKTYQDARSYIRNELTKEKPVQYKTNNGYEENAYFFTIAFPEGTRERIEALSLNKTDADFIRDVVLGKLDELEKILL